MSSPTVIFTGHRASSASTVVVVVRAGAGASQECSWREPGAVLGIFMFSGSVLLAMTMNKIGGVQLHPLTALGVPNTKYILLLKSGWRATKIWLP